MARKLLMFGGIVLLSVLLLCGVGGYAIYRWIDGAGVDETTFNAITIGAPEAEARRSLPDSMKLPASEVYADTDKTRGAMPAGATCEHYLAQQQDAGPNAHV